MIPNDLMLAVLATAIVSTVFLVILFLQLKKEKFSALQSLLENEQLKSSNEHLNMRNEELLTSLKDLEDKQASSTQLISDLTAIKGQFEQLQSQYGAITQQLSTKDEQLDKFRQQIALLEKKLAELNKQLEHEKKTADEKIELLENAKKQLSDEFKLLANQIFEQKQSQFTQASQATLEATLKPMQGVLNEFKSRVERVHKEDLEGRASLSEQLKQLQVLNSQMSAEAHNLTQALKGDSKTQGNWGELILEKLLERSGLTEGIEFEREKSFSEEGGRRLRPDVIINMPDNKHVVIDSKVSLSDYEKALNAPSDIERQAALRAHLNSLKKHIQALSSKRYEHLEQLNAPDFVLMFIPVEGAYMMAIEADSRVFEDAFEKKVAVVTPTTLFTTLKTIEQLWRYERQSENTVKLIKRAAEVHDKFVGFIDTFEKVGSQFETAHSSYQKARNQLIHGNGNLIRQAEMLKDLAGKTKKEIPAHLLEEAEGNKIEVRE